MKNHHFHKDKVEKALLQFGLTEKEISIYLMLLENGVGSVQEISRQSGINRVTIYAGLDQLKTKGLVAETKKGSRTLFVAENPENLGEILEKKKAVLKSEEETLNNFLIPALKAVNTAIPDKPQILFFEGAEGIGRVFDAYALKYSRLIGCGSYAEAFKVMSKKDEIWFVEEIKRRKIVYRMVLRDTPEDRQFAAEFKGFFHAKFLPTTEAMPADIHVFGPYVALMSYATLGTTLIKDETIAKAIKLYIEFMWERL
jgi:predicted DNA-binding transcriptional regulator